jgi:hypothetical protein
MTGNTEKSKSPGFCTPKRCCVITCLLFLLSAIGVLVWYFVYFKSEAEGIASCGDCFCIPDEGESCPLKEPRTNFTSSEIIRWKRQKIVNPYELKCDPFTERTCKTTPEQDEALVNLGNTAVCAIHTAEENNNTSSCESASFRLKTYASQAEAEAAGGFVTHVGHCGVCSTLQDLAVYLEHPGLTTEGKFCNSQSSISVEGGLACYRNLGLTDACAKVWADSEANTFIDCFKECFFDDITQKEPNNGPAPECKLNNCLQCDQDQSAQSLAQFAGRTRHRSGLLSPVARKCNELALVEHVTCPATKPAEATTGS